MAGFYTHPPQLESTVPGADGADGYTKDAAGYTLVVVGW